MTGPPAGDLNAHEVEVHFAERYMTSSGALGYLREQRQPPPGRSWDEARMLRQSINRSGVTFTFYFLPKQPDERNLQ